MMKPTSPWRAALLTLISSALPAIAVDSTTVFNEVMYHPAGAADSEWIEIHNQMSVNMDLSGWRITGGVNYTFLTGTTIPAGGYLVIAANPTALEAASGISGVLGPWTGALSNENETITLKNKIGRVMDEFSYRDSGEFPPAADGGGVSLAKRSSRLASGKAGNWTYSSQVGGTPTEQNFATGPTLGPAVTLSDYNAPWLYNQTGADLGASWAQTTYTAGSGNWLSGPGVLAFGAGELPLPVGTALAEPASGVVTHYFQRTFNFNGNPAETELQLKLLVDDGAVIYLNGAEIARSRLSSGPVTNTTTATEEVDTATVIELPVQATNLHAGANVLSAEVHRYVEPPPQPPGPPSSGGSVQLNGGGLVLAQLGGAVKTATDLAVVSTGSVAFAKDCLPGYTQHTIPHLNDGIHGNSFSWIANTANSFCGVNLGATPKTLRSIAWSRDQTGGFGDRSIGLYTIQYTTTPNPNELTPDAAWTTLGTANYVTVGGAFSTALRHQYNFDAVDATGIRIITSAAGTCVDELELYSTPAEFLGSGGPVSTTGNPGFSITRVGPNGTNTPVPDNFALASNGSVAFGSSQLNHVPSPGVVIHRIPDVIDGIYGNSNSWISNTTPNQYIGVAFPGPKPMSRIAWGRDNLAQFTDRSLGTYTLQYTTVASPGTGTAETDNATTGWKTIGTVQISGSDATFTASRRHVYAVDAGGAPIIATGLRIKVSDPQICIDEIEVTGAPQNDVVFGAQVVSRSILPPPGTSTLEINEIGGSTDAVWKLELRNSGSTPIALGGMVVAASNATGGYVLPAQNLAAGAVLVLDQTQLGFRPPLDARVFVYTPGRGTLLDAASVRTTVRARQGARFLAPTAATFGGANTFSLNTSIVINEIMYHGPRQIGPPPTDDPEEWVELYNKGATSVDLGGWKLDDGIEYTFPAGVTLAAGEYLVIAKDAAALTTKWPEQAARIRGNFSGSLSNDGERVVLLDAIGNPASEVSYLTGGAWPETPDGGGASLELRDPRANVGNGASWGTSTPLVATDWQTVSYTMNSTQSFGNTQWNEFRLGMLDGGECLVDDVSVIRVSSGQQLIQGGDFETLTNKWRLLGNHGQSAIESEPGNPGNHVLHIRASGPFASNHNHIESTYVGNTALVEGQSYTVSFRARWLSGSNLLNSRSYYSRLARTTALNMPSRLGTPGRVNTQKVTNLGPSLSSLAHSPAIPDAGVPVKVTVRAQDVDGMGAVNLRYAVDGSASFATIPMTASEDLYTAEIPGFDPGSIVQFYVEAADTPGATSMLPATGPASRALYVINNGDGTTLPAHEFRVIMLPADSTFLLAELNRISDARVGGTVVYQRDEVFYDIGVRLQGTAAGRIRDGDPYVGYDVGFKRDHLFRGVHDSVNLDRSGRAPVTRGQDEIYIKHMFNRAGIPCSYDDLVYFVAPASQHTGTAILQMAGYEGTFVESQYNEDGTVFNLDITYDPSTTIVPSDVESLKRPVPLAGHVGADFTYWGADKEQYRGQFEPRAGRGYDDFSGLMSFTQLFAANPQDHPALTAKMDLDEWMRCTALYSLSGIADCYFTAGLKHNVRFWVPRDGTGIQVLPWDMDFVFAGPSGLYTCDGRLRALIDSNPVAKRLYLGHMHDLCNTVFEPGYMTPWLTHYGTVVGQSMAVRASTIASRRNAVLNALPAQVPFEITTNGGADFTVGSPTTTLTGTGWINVREFRRTDTGEMLPASWVDDGSGNLNWQLTVALNNGANPLTIEALDYQGASVATDSIIITSTSTQPRPKDFLRITELMYHPAAPVGAETSASLSEEDFEFIELRNLGAQPLDISGCKFVEGIDFTFPANTILAGGEHIMVVRHLAAFRARYGAAPRVAGVYGPNDSLNNAGETITLEEVTAGAIIQSFNYKDGNPWPVAADGGGYSLVSISPQSALDRSLASNWRLSTTLGGNPNGTDNTSFTGVATDDGDRDGLNKFLEYALGTSDTLPNPVPSSLVADGATLLFTFKRTANADDVLYALEGSATVNAQGFAPATATLLSVTTSGGIATETWRVTPTGAAYFVRLKVQSR